uniref:Uncharacterized protein n=1 Tax=Anguilla anguilla TaxID=7936 RepID=A0A0E9T9I0_ANGAN
MLVQPYVIRIIKNITDQKNKSKYIRVSQRGVQPL